MKPNMTWKLLKFDDAIRKQYIQFLNHSQFQIRLKLSLI
ncbi:unnamed protein product [Paramecium sonneborni]|uniref:Uncharacterized protein n=1 Tax=Paramecium sonneborni TaxID=65129 RepID=A0A8S1NHH3_9CILI|nr:unnamed protein product [Paramecium sonneborni]